MQVVQQVAKSCCSGCGSCASPSSQALALLPAAALTADRLARDFCSSRARSPPSDAPQQPAMALHSLGLLSPTKQHALLGGGGAGGPSPAGSPARPALAPSATANAAPALSPPLATHKRRLQQRGSPSRPAAGAILHALTGAVATSPCAAAAAAASCAGALASPGRCCCPTAKRLELDGPRGAAAPHRPAPRHHPVTPAVSQPQPLLHLHHQQQPAAGGPDAAAALGGGAGGPAVTPGAAARLAHHLAALPLLRTGGSGGATAATAAGSGGFGAGSTRDADDGRCCSDQLPSPTAVLDFPPELEAAANACQQQQQQHASTAWTAAGPPLLQPPVPHQQQHQHGHQTPPPPQQRQQQQQQRAAHTMSGRRLSLRYDIPVGLEWLEGLPAHAPALGAGVLEVIVGPMFAGKTTALIERVKEVTGQADHHHHRHQQQQQQRVAVAVKSSKDARYSSHWVVSHDGRCMRCYTAASLAEFRAMMGHNWHKLEVVAIDEAQFFPDLVEFCEAAVDGDGKHVIVAGLSGDFRRRRFGQVLDLLPMADRLVQLTSKCGFCDADALFSLRLASGGPQEVVGGDEMYRPTCRRCFLQRGGAGGGSTME